MLSHFTLLVKQPSVISLDARLTASSIECGECKFCKSGKTNLCGKGEYYAMFVLSEYF